MFGHWTKIELPKPGAGKWLILKILAADHFSWKEKWKGIISDQHINFYISQVYQHVDSFFTHQRYSVIGKD